MTRRDIVLVWVASLAFATLFSGCETTGSYQTAPAINYQTGFPLGSEQDMAATTHNMEVESQISTLQNTIDIMHIQQSSTP